MYITHCPECDTAFKVTDEQLSLANGWARCGRCGAVFDAISSINAEKKSTPQKPVQPELAPSENFLAPKPQAMAQTPEQEQEPQAKIWMIATAVLSVLLLWQLILLQRDRMAAEEPALKSALSAMCVPFFCEVKWPRHPDFVKIENSSFNEDPGKGYAMQLRIKNTQLYSVATPNLELTLTDLQDQVVVRRVLTPQEMGVSDHIGPLRDAKVQLSFGLAPEFGTRVSGFRAIIFYP